MITKAIIEELISPYECRIRIPLIDGLDASTLSTPYEELGIACICSLPQCYLNSQVGDIVFIGFEDNLLRKPVILGHLLKESTTYSDLCINSLEVVGNTILSYNTSIGDVSSHDISCLKGTKDNIQKQLEDLTQRIINIEQDKQYEEDDAQ